eukprot:scaffold65052_cov20-Tisochrysis_lutea.AAC.2
MLQAIASTHTYTYASASVHTHPHTWGAKRGMARTAASAAAASSTRFLYSSTQQACTSIDRDCANVQGMQTVSIDSKEGKDFHFQQTRQFSHTCKEMQAGER